MRGIDFQSPPDNVVEEKAVTKTVVAVAVSGGGGDDGSGSNGDNIGKISIR